MLQAGKRQELTVIKKVDFGVYLAEAEDHRGESVLLPKKQVPADCSVGSKLKVFLYFDSKDRLISTTSQPLLLLHETAVLKVKSVGKIGAFLDWGLEKDLFLPFKEQTRKVSAGDEVLSALYTDKSGRLCATMKVFQYLKLNPPYSIGDMLPARVYNINPKFGVFIAVEDKYSGLIPSKDVHGTFNIGDKLLVRIVQIREDGRIDASPNQKAYLKIDGDAEIIYKRIEQYKGVLPFDDHASPELIDKEFALSKAAFKRAVGRLLKERKIKIEDGKIISI
jgi:predicted RNA-binding protein (virulence factor B family)